MRIQILIRSAIVGALLCLSGCQTLQWKEGGTPYTAKDGSFTIQIPSGWTYAEERGGHIVGTRDGFLLQRILLEKRELKEALPYSKRVLNPGLTPLELAEAIIDDARADRMLLGIEIAENQPETLGGKPGFKLVINFHTADKLRVSEEVIGCIQGDHLYLLVFSAPTRFYFGRDRAAFEEGAKMFQFTKP